jgi:hypothetical protein
MATIRVLRKANQLQDDDVFGLCSPIRINDDSYVACITVNWSDLLMINRTRMKLSLKWGRSTDFDQATLDWMFHLTKRNMRSLYVCSVVLSVLIA